MKPIRILTYNIHKGFTTGNLNFVLKNIKSSIRETNADIVFLQEVVGTHHVHSKKVKDWPTAPQFEFLADEVWPHFAYGKNAVYSSGHHGNAILSKFPITFWENEDVSFSKFERRGLLHAVIPHPKTAEPLHVFCLHLGLFENDRKAQILKLSKRIDSIVPKNAPIIIAGDFNDWRQNSSDILIPEMGMKEAFLELEGQYVKTYPSWFPMLSLDRIYYRNLECTSVQVLKDGIWNKLSDHLPLVGAFKW